MIVGGKVVGRAGVGGAVAGEILIGGVVVGGAVADGEVSSRAVVGGEVVGTTLTQQNIILSLDLFRIYFKVWQVKILHVFFSLSLSLLNWKAVHVSNFLHFVRHLLLV